MLVNLSELKTVPSILVHTCCAPCLGGVIDALKQKSDKRIYYFFNPNIHPYSEYLKRKETLEKFLSLNHESPLINESYDLVQYFEMVSGTESYPERCRFCYRLRLQESARKAAELSIDYFTTTILSSPFQQHEIAVEEGLRAAETFDLVFVYYNIRNNYYDGVNKVRKHGLYYQWYCGCIFSEFERLEEKNKNGIRG